MDTVAAACEVTEVIETVPFIKAVLVLAVELVDQVHFYSSSAASEHVFLDSNKLFR